MKRSSGLRSRSLQTRFVLDVHTNLIFVDCSRPYCAFHISTPGKFRFFVTSSKLSRSSSRRLEHSALQVFRCTGSMSLQEFRSNFFFSYDFFLVTSACRVQNQWFPTFQPSPSHSPYTRARLTSCFVSLRVRVWYFRHTHTDARRSTSDAAPITRWPRTRDRATTGEDYYYDRQVFY